MSATDAPRGGGNISFQGKLPAVMVMGLVVQVVAGIWQVAQIHQEISDHRRRIERLEISGERAASEQMQRTERFTGAVARLEVVVETLAGTTARLERRLDAVR